jgi:hypothetical protein
MVSQPEPGSRARIGETRGRREMCRSIKTLRRPDEPATEDEIRAAARQYVRKISGYRNPSRANLAAFEAAVDDIARASNSLLESLIVKA